MKHNIKNIENTQILIKCVLILNIAYFIFTEIDFLTFLGKWIFYLNILTFLFVFYFLTIKSLKKKILILDNSHYERFLFVNASNLYHLFCIYEYKKFIEKKKALIISLYSIIEFKYYTNKLISYDISKYLVNIEKNLVNIEKNLTDQFLRLCFHQFKEHLEAFNKKYKEGFTKDEIISILAHYQALNLEKFWNQMQGITGIIVDGEYLIFSVDVFIAFRTSLEDRDLYYYEFD